MKQKEVLHCFLRVSSEVQVLGTLLKVQERLGIDKAAQLNMVPKFYLEAGASAKNDELEKRPKLRELIAR